jgi:hydroxypyruvate reductase
MKRPEVERVLRRAFARALGGFDLSSRVKRALEGNPARRVVAVGKAATAMLAGAFRPAQEALLIVPDGTTIGWSAPSTRIVLSAHPLPTRRSIEAAEAALAFVARGDVVILLSGGASSLMALPIEGMDLADKRAAVDQLLRAGVPVRDINIVRRHMSRVKGGRLGAAAAGRVLTIIASDVIGGGPADVGSGPTVIDPTTVADARAVLDRVGLSVPLEESVKADHPRAQALEHRFIARPEDFAAVMKQALEDEGLTVFDMPPTEDDVESL